MLSEYIQKLQGTWKRQSYPFGTIEFKKNQVKFTEGEGSSQPPEFKNFDLIENCNSTINSIPKKLYDFGLVTDSKDCNAIKLTGNTFNIYFD